MMLRNIYRALYLPFIISSTDTHNSIDLLNSFTGHITNYATIIMPPQTISSLKHLNFIQELAKRFPSILLNHEGLMTIPDTKDVQDVTRFFALKSQRKLLKIVFLDATYTNATQELIDIVKVLIDSKISSPSSKCAIILIHSNGEWDLQRLFKLSWMNELLYITIIEFRKEQTRKAQLLSQTIYHNAIVHQYNSFNNSYTNESLSTTVDLFSDKLSDLYGFSLNTAIYEESPHVTIKENYKRNNMLDAMYGIDVELTKTLAKRLNFSINIRGIVSNSKYLHTSNMTMGDIYKGFETGKLDFGLNLAAIIGRPTITKDYTVNLGTFMFTTSASILVKQYGTYKVHMPFHIILIVLLTITCITILALLLKFDNKIWTYHNVTKILMGQTIQHAPRKINERIFYLCLALIHVLFFVGITESLLNIFIYQKTYLQLKTINETINAGIVPYIVDFTKQVLLKHTNDSVLKRLIEKSNTLETYDIMKNCWFSLLNDKARSVNGCQIRGVIGKEIERNFAANKENHLITLVDEPIFPGTWASMLSLLMWHDSTILCVDYSRRVW